MQPGRATTGPEAAKSVQPGRANTGPEAAKSVQPGRANTGPEAAKSISNHVLDSDDAMLPLDNVIAIAMLPLR